MCAASSVFLLPSFLNRHYNRRQSLLTNDRDSASTCVRVLLHIAVEGLGFASVYLEVANPTDGAVWTHMALLCVAEFVNLLFLFAWVGLLVGVLVVTAFACVV